MYLLLGLSLGCDASGKKWQKVGFGSFEKVVLVGAFCKIGVSDTGGPVQNLGVFRQMRRIWRIRGWYNIIWRLWGLYRLWGFCEGLCILLLCYLYL